MADEVPPRDEHARSRSHARAVDSLLNYETVKYFGNEAHELERFDEAKQIMLPQLSPIQRALTVSTIGRPRRSVRARAPRCQIFTVS